MYKNSLLRGSFGLFGLGLLATPLTSAADDIRCGDTLYPGGTYELVEDVGPCDTDPALEVVGPTTLNLNGFKVICKDRGGMLGVPNGIVASGSGARIENGSVTGCFEGLSLEGEGNHAVLNVRSYGNEDDGIDIVETSANNEVEDSRFFRNGDDGVDVDGNDNKIENNIVYRNGDNGFAINGADNDIEDNFSIKNADRGFDVDGDGNELEDNKALANGEDGIRVDEGMNTDVEENIAFGNNVKGEPDAFDVNDENCVGNEWEDNIFKTSNPDSFCIE